MSEGAARRGGVLHFLGGAASVTGSRFLVDGKASRLLVDCGLYQGPKHLRVRNWQPFPVDPASIDAVLLTHAHIDHSGYLPRLYRDGFRGKVIATRATQELCRVLLRDSARLQEEQARYANVKGFSKHDPALPLYTEEDAEGVLERFRHVEFDAWHEVAEGARARFTHAGHILGSAGITLDLDEQVRIGWSGDLGRPHHPILVPPAPPPDVDALLVESTYGDRSHDDAGVVEVLASAISRTAERGGITVIPAFAVDRTEVVLSILHSLMDAGRIPRLTIYVDSPMALAALDIYRRAVQEGWPEVRPELHGNPESLDPGTLVEAHSVSDSQEINKVTEPAIIVSASGMATGGRILHHLARRLPDARNSVILVGYQAIGTRGRRLFEGEPSVKMLGRYVPVRAEIVDASALSVHADREELLAWIAAAPSRPGVTYVVHGEEKPAERLREAIEEQTGGFAVVPRLGERILVEPR